MEQHETEQTQANGNTGGEETVHEIKKEEKKEWMLPASIIFAAIVIGAAFIYASGPIGATTVDQPEKTAATAPPVTDKDVIVGAPNAPMTIIEYGDFQCPGCVSFFAVGEGLIRQQLVETGKAKFIFYSV